MVTGEEVRLIFRRPEQIVAQASGAGEVRETLIAKVDELTGWFKRFSIESIEIWIEAAAKAGKVVNLFVSAEGKGGVKITLKPTE